jgi:hypothetical protein
MKNIFYLILCLGLFSTCSYVVEDYKQGESQRYVSVEAELSDIAERSFVNLTYSSEKTINDVVFTPIEKAKVYFIDNQGKKELLTEINYGFYKPSSTFKGEVGKTYTLRIETKDGGIYESQAEKMLSVPPIDNVYEEFEERTNYPVGSSGRYAFNLYLDFKDSPSPDEYYQWAVTNYSQVVYCKRCEQSQLNPNTLSCEKARFRQTTYIYGCKEKCFNINPAAEIYLLSDKNVNGNNIKRQKLGNVPLGDLTRYYALIEQRRLTENAFVYINALKQQRNNGTFFDVPALIQFSNNIKSVSNPTEKIIGVWNVFSTVQKPLIIERNKIIIKDYTPQPPFIDGVFEIPNLIFFPCEESVSRTKIVPQGWK